MFATHPPLQQRILHLDKHWDGKYLIPQTENPTESAQNPSTKDGRTTTATGVISTDLLQAIDSIGQPRDVHLNNAGKLLQELPPTLLIAAREPYKARAVIYTLVISDEADFRDIQLVQLKQHGDNGVYSEVISILPQVRQLNRKLRLPLIDIALGSLRQLSPTQYQLFRGNLLALIKTDNHMGLFEWALQKIVHHHLDNAFEKRSPLRRSVKYIRLGQLHHEAALVVSLLAYTNQGGSQIAHKAFTSAAKILNLPEFSLLPLDHIKLASLDSAIDKLILLNPLSKPQFLKACVACIISDGIVSEIETELLRAIADTIDCPMPPIIG